MADRLERLLVEVAAGQDGLVTGEQARQLGMSARAVSRRATSGRWERCQPGVYRVAGAPVTWRQQLRAACLAGGPDALVSHRAAAALWGFERMAAPMVEVSAPRWLRRPGSGVVVHESQDLQPADRHQIGGIPVTNALRVVVDIGHLVHVEQLETMVNEGLRRGWFTLPELVARHRQVARRGRNGCGPLRSILDEIEDQGGLAHTGFEVRMARLIERLGFERPRPQVKVFGAAGRFVAQVDLAYPDLRVAIEADSETWHVGRHHFHDDRARWNEIKAAGWEVLVYTYRHYRSDHPHIRRTLGSVMAQQRHRLALRPPPPRTTPKLRS